MSDFSSIDRAKLAYLVPAAEGLAERSARAYMDWLKQLGDDEHALILQWGAYRGNNWPTQPHSKEEQLEKV